MCALCLSGLPGGRVVRGRGAARVAGLSMNDVVDGVSGRRVDLPCAAWAGGWRRGETHFLA